MIHPISKTVFIDYRHCPKNTWLKLHKSELLEKFILSDFERHLIEQGNEVESCARNLFPGGIEVVSRGEEACQETIRLMATNTPTVFQSTFIIDGFIARNDMLSYNKEMNLWDLYEVKGTNSLKEKENKERDHIEDVAFQASILKRANVSTGRYYVIHLNKEYVRYGNLDINKLFIKEDVTDKIIERLPEIEKQMEVALEYLSKETEPAGNCECIYQGRKKHCTTFKYSNPHIPEYSIHDISRITETKLNRLIEDGVIDLNDIPEDFELTDIQKNQILSHSRQKPIINISEIKKELDSLRYPLYFFDYEAFGPAIPIFDGFSPYKHIPFQFSLHILDNKDAKLRHVEFLHKEKIDPSEKVMELLKKHVSPNGTIIVWHKSFEDRINRELGVRMPENSEFIKEINNSLYDLEDIFKKQHYVHHGFKGSTSVKKILPTIAPELSYKELDINEGGQAADAWWKMVSPATSVEESKKIASDLKRYCGLDTYAMYAIWRCLIEKINQ